MIINLFPQRNNSSDEKKGKIAMKMFKTLAIGAIFFITMFGNAHANEYDECKGWTTQKGYFSAGNPYGVYFDILFCGGPVPVPGIKLIDFGGKRGGVYTTRVTIGTIVQARYDRKPPEYTTFIFDSGESNPTYRKCDSQIFLPAAKRSDGSYEIKVKGSCFEPGGVMVMEKVEMRNGPSARLNPSTKAFMKG